MSSGYSCSWLFEMGPYEVIDVAAGLAGEGAWPSLSTTLRVPLNWPFWSNGAQSPEHCLTIVCDYLQAFYCLLMVLYLV